MISDTLLACKVFNHPVTAQKDRFSECSWKASRLWSDAISMSVWRGTRCIDRSLRQHQSTSKDRSVVFLLHLTRLSCFSFFIVFPKCLDGGGLLAHVANHEWHREVIQTMTP